MCDGFLFNLEFDKNAFTKHILPTMFSQQSLLCATSTPNPQGKKREVIFYIKHMEKASMI